MHYNSGCNQLLNLLAKSSKLALVQQVAKLAQSDDRIDHMQEHLFISIRTTKHAHMMVWFLRRYPAGRVGCVDNNNTKRDTQVSHAVVWAAMWQLQSVLDYVFCEHVFVNQRDIASTSGVEDKDRGLATASIECLLFCSDKHPTRKEDGDCK